MEIDFKSPRFLAIGVLVVLAAFIIIPAGKNLLTGHAVMGAPSIVCTETDSGPTGSGKDPFVQGALVRLKDGQIATLAMDYCLDDKQLSEIFCAEPYNPIRQTIDCANGCAEGACRR